MTLEQVGLRVAIQVDVVRGLSIVWDEGFLQGDPLLLQLLYLAHVHVVNARLRKLLSCVGLAFFVVDARFVGLRHGRHCGLFVGKLLAHSFDVDVAG